MTRHSALPEDGTSKGHWVGFWHPVSYLPNSSLGDSLSRRGATSGRPQWTAYDSCLLPRFTHFSRLFPALCDQAKRFCYDMTENQLETRKCAKVIRPLTPMCR